LSGQNGIPTGILLLHSCRAGRQLPHLVRRFAACVNGRAILAHAHLRRTGIVALIVGVWLTAFNQSDAPLAGQWTLRLAIKIALNVLTPFVVANFGLLSRQRHY
jgi:hypothetical protein